MIKFSQPDLFDFGVEPISIITDKCNLTKRASAEHLLKYAKTKGQTDLHIIALGAYEGTGPNRNLDLFKEAECEKNYHYFLDAGRAVHRHHKNKPSDPKFGNIKAAAYNKPMKRIELIVGLDNDKCADILDEQEKKGHTNWSMASKQEYDICTFCQKKAANDSERCEHIPDKLGELNKYGEICAMENPNPKWFEISYVRRPADRIGMSLQKAASEKVRPLLTRDYLSLYPDIEVPADEYLISKKASDKRALLKKLSEMEKHLDGLGVKDKNKLPVVNTEKIAAEVMDELRSLDPAKFFKLAADQGIILSPDNFFSYVFGDRIKQAAIDSIKTHLPNIFSTLEKDAEICNSEKYEPSSNNILALQDRTIVRKLANTHSLNTPYIKARLVSNTIKEAAHTSQEKTADKQDILLANEYAKYKLAALNYIDENNKLDDDLVFAVVLQNK